MIFIILSNDSLSLVKYLKKKSILLSFTDNLLKFSSPMHFAVACVRISGANAQNCKQRTKEVKLGAIDRAHTTLYLFYLNPFRVKFPIRIYLILDHLR